MTDVFNAVRGACSRAAGRLHADAWVLLQQALAATVAWVLATHVIDHRRPFFAPMAAVVALNAPLGQRGGNALRLLEGVIIGILAGELGLGALGATSGALFLATLVSMVTSRALGGTPLTLAQAATAAILTVSTGNAHVGPERLIDALIGGGVALVFSQVLFTPEPVRLLRRAEAGALTDIANAFDLTAKAIEENDQELAGRAIASLRNLRDRLAELGRTRDASKRVSRTSAVWRSRLEPVVQESEYAGQLDLLGASALMVVRSATAAQGDERGVLAPAVRQLAAEVHRLAQNPGDRPVRQRAVNGVLEAARRLRSHDEVHDAVPDSSLTAPVIAMRSAAVDIMVFAGVDADQAAQAIHRDGADPHVPKPTPGARPAFKRALQSWTRMDN